jgi:hypothetical protein
MIYSWRRKMKPNHFNSSLYILGDADRVRQHIDRELLASNLEAVTNFSAKLTQGLLDLARASEEFMSAETIMAGGDDVLFRVDANKYSQESLKQIADAFQQQTGCTISFGVGVSVALAYLNLRRAKAEGGGGICSCEASP